MGHEKAPKVASLQKNSSAPLRNDSDEKFLIVTPGIRPRANVDDGSDDQKRIATAKQAIINGADHVVIGRPIQNLHKEIAEGLAKKS